MTTIVIKKDVKSYKDKTDPKSPHGWFGAKHPLGEVNLEELTKIMSKHDFIGLHEVLTGDIYRPYADLDWDTDVTEANFEKKKKDVLARGKAVMEKVFPEADWGTSWCSSRKKPNGTWKISGHFIGLNIYFTSKQHIKYLLEKELGPSSTWKPQGWDASVYDANHCFRLPFCAKAEDPSAKIRPVEIKNFGGEIIPMYGCYDATGKYRDFEMDEGFIAAGLITMVDPDEKKMPVPEGFVEPVKPVKAMPVDGEPAKPLTDEQKTEMFEKLRKLISALSPARASVRNSWTQGIWAIRRIAEKYGLGGRCLALAHEFAKKTDQNNYSEAATIDIYMEPVKEIGVGWKRLNEWADEDTPGWDKDVFEIDWKRGDNFDIAQIKALAKHVKRLEDISKFATAMVDYMNHFYTLIKKGSKVCVISEEYATDAQSGKQVKKIDFNSKEAMTTDFENKDVYYKLTGDKEDMKLNPWKCWMAHPKRNDKSRICFNPKADAGEQYVDSLAYNMYDGLEITREMCKDAPDLKPDNPWLQHIKHRWCDDKEKLFNSVLNRFALQIQKPWIRTASALGLMSPEGSGKSLGLDPIFDIIGRKYIAEPTSSSQVLGNFNALLVGKLIVYLDEMTWGGQKEAEGVIKKLTSQPYFSLERKGVDAVQIDNWMNLLMASNEDWVVAASKKARRWEMLELSSDLAGIQTKETKAIIDSILAVDILSIAKFLYARDLSGYNPREIQVTDALRSQKIESMDSVDAAWLPIINRNVIAIDDMEINLAGQTIEKNKVYAAIGAPIKFMNDTKFWKKVKLLFPSIQEIRPTEGKKRVQKIVFPHLDTLRKDFRNMYNDAEWTFDEPDELDATDNMDE